MNVLHLFQEHPASVGETYLGHMRVALSFALFLAVAAVVCFIHAFAPWLFTSTGSEIIQTLHNKMVLHRDRRVETHLTGDEATHG